MRDPIYCPAQTFRGTREEPSEYCTNEVADYGDMCEQHDEEERAAEAYESWRKE